MSRLPRARPHLVMAAWQPGSLVATAVSLGNGFHLDLGPRAQSTLCTVVVVQPNPPLMTGGLKPYCQQCWQIRPAPGS